MVKDKNAEKAYNQTYHIIHKDEIRIRKKAYYEANKEKLNSYTKIWCKANKDKIKIHAKVYYKANKDKINACSKVYRETNKDRLKAYRETNKDRLKAHAKAYHEANKDKRNAFSKAYYEANKDKITTYCEANKDKLKAYYKVYYKANKDKINAYLRVYLKEKRKTNAKFRLNDDIRSAIRKSLKGNKNGKHWEDIVGYTLKQLKKHLEKQFTEGMTWENYGQWHVDHKIPISVFNFTKPEHRDFKRCWTLKNLQPMWAKDNQSKSNKLTNHFQPSLLI